MYPSEFELTVLATMQHAQEIRAAATRRQAAQARRHDEGMPATADWPWQRFRQLTHSVRSLIVDVAVRPNENAASASGDPSSAHHERGAVPPIGRMA